MKMAKQFRFGFGRRVANALLIMLLRAGLPVPKATLLTVRGRKSGNPHMVPVQLIDLNGQRWLVAPYGVVDWVRNIRASHQAVLTRSRRSESITVIEVSQEEAAPVLKRYLEIVPLVRPYFIVTTKSSLADIAREAPLHPVFRIQPAP
jgi:deazaflavin-dependent oxidoreductase (nitroreductase family)